MLVCPKCIHRSSLKSRSSNVAPFRIFSTANSNFFTNPFLSHSNLISTPNLANGSNTPNFNARFGSCISAGVTLSSQTIISVLNCAAPFAKISASVRARALTSSTHFSSEIDRHFVVLWLSKLRTRICASRAERARLA
ncbi:hypothetical protein BCR34DRAFT_354276 [Clohesyomyces aquaticus]|uniref:Uncharacterized protein n=1 Tax=Clohesyomyces aquaticus TaxID=1231657 RepID=A0A1Y1ZJR2_9PLEO|nr:hypothetical protein BCR34DRAFT_354276 [Clohesyomyces aquaticus]